MLKNKEAPDYVFPIYRAENEASPASLQEILPLLKRSQDRLLADNLLKYSIPCKIKILNSENSDENTGFVFLNIREEAKVYKNKLRLPYLNLQLKDTVNFNLLSTDESYTYALSSPDIMTVLGQPGTGKTTVLNRIVTELTGIEPNAEFDSVTKYEHKLRLQNTPDLTIVNEAASVFTYFQNFVFSERSAAKILEEFIDKYSQFFSFELFVEIIECMDSLLPNLQKSEPKTERLKNNLYKLMQKSADFSLLREATERLKKIENFEPETAALQQLYETYENTESWRNSLTENVKALLLKLNLRRDSYISDEKKARITNMFNKAITELTKRVHKNHKDDILNDYIREVEKEPEIISNYLNPFNFEKPVVIGGVLLANMDICNEELLLKQLETAKKIILFSSHYEGIFKAFYEKAFAREKLDGLIRTGALRENYIHHFAIAEFINRNFYENFEIITKDATTEKEPGFVWINKGSDRLMGHIFSCLNQNYSIGIITDNYDYVKQMLEHAGLDLTALTIGRYEKFKNRHFDVIYVCAYSFKESEKRDMLNIISRAVITFVYVEDSGKAENTILKNLYLECIKGGSYGQVYN